LSLLGTIHGGNGADSFALPDLRDSIPMQYVPYSLRVVGEGYTNSDQERSGSIGELEAALGKPESGSPSAPPRDVAEIGVALTAVNVCIARQRLLPNAKGEQTNEREESKMSEAFVGEIRLFFGTSTPPGWALCEGQILPLTDNTKLFSILGTNYGSDCTGAGAKWTFALPDLRGRAMIGTNIKKQVPPGAKGEHEGWFLPRDESGMAPRYIIALDGTFPLRAPYE